ncbi:MAG: D-glucuronyl C5-epimerase family protein [candidate division KSB1 bacterium]|nr:D-glucuronyl C5-epimerase family protein [candidate division KSB1 bacterium]MDZ7334838.1 D-glucuronyl C5-epimerase family protein [candidate division KSB1 bacterium]MDZ7357881.1 D-glucuronyl C5-epimerase family protein [candidate division KSB1 bacterium]MDZ7400433.1 D-glucuronyl C5-epimerase family protein [candidate division KSB1 bacterium]
MNLGLYPINYQASLGEDFSEYEFNSHGIPLTRFERRPDWQHNPITVCQYALHHFNRYWREKLSRSKEIFLNQANWLAQNAEDGPSNSKVWYYRIAIPLYGITPRWISGMAQGEALSVLLRAHQLTNDPIFLDTAIGAMKIFSVKVQEGGVIASFPDGRPIIEEYPSPHFMTGVLNGFIFAMFGVYEYARYLDDPHASELFSQLSNSLRANLQRYDAGFWSYYDQHASHRLASRAYHRLHIEQLKRLAELTGEPVFHNYELRWRTYINSNYCQLRWLLSKIRQKWQMKFRSIAEI